MISTICSRKLQEDHSLHPKNFIQQNGGKSLNNKEQGLVAEHLRVEENIVNQLMA